jgi:hypothetical protein
MQFIVAGFHRSGTSVLTQLLHRAGLFVGDELLGSMPTNPHGHFEDRDFLRLHRAIMERHGSGWQWDSPFPFFIGPDHWRRMRQLARKRDLAHRHWGFKDPRVCLLLGAWKHVMPDAKVVIVYRDPGECVRSLESRQAANLFKGTGQPEDHLRFFREPDHGLRLWDTYNRAVVAFAQAHPADCLTVPFHELLDGLPVIDRINDTFGSDLEAIGIESVLDLGVAGRREAPQPYHSERIASRVTETWQALEDLAQTREVA